MFKQVWIGGKKSTGYWNLNKFQNLKLLKKNDVFLYFCREIGSDLDTRSPINFGSALDIWVSASSSWTLDGFWLSVLGRLILISAISSWAFDIGSAFVFGRLILVSTFGSWTFQLLVLGCLIYRFRLLVLGCLLLISAFGSWFRLSVLGRLLLISAFSSYAFDLKLSVVMAATSHWALDRFRLQYLLKLWVSVVISLGIEMVSAAISLDL
ncbi:uncharacterized protein OCT59_024320 [Rhizophagus irregularis]|uniref:uncharacterized protein n=1 Tax=Rhizophagus irregularis TaxID=588596 RepID=UPI0033199125|nr:hypothetical protein OCT59_024320 [Rhizophagus irregularis]